MTECSVCRSSRAPLRCEWKLTFQELWIQWQEEIGEGGAALLEAAWRSVFAMSVLWQRLRNSELVIQSKSLGTRRTEGGGSPCSQRRFEVRLQSRRRLGGKSRWFLLWSLSTLSELWVFTVFWTLPDWVSFGSFIDITSAYCSGNIYVSCWNTAD